MNTTVMEIQQLSWRMKQTPILKEVSFQVKTGEFLGIVGANGCGKTSLISLMAGLRKPQSGNIFLRGKKLEQYSRRQIAQQVALVEQQTETSDRLTAIQAVELGRTPYLSLLHPWDCNDDAIVADALAKVAMQPLANRYWLTLSGGERQRLHIARALAQQPQILLLDEPTNHLDIKHQIGLLDLVRQLGLTVVAALHDLNHAAMFCDRVLMMHQGQIAQIGKPVEIFTVEHLQSFFGISARIETTEDRCFIRYERPEMNR